MPGWLSRGDIYPLCDHRILSVLVAKKIMFYDEVLEEIKAVRREMEGKRGK